MLGLAGLPGHVDGDAQQATGGSLQIHQIKPQTGDGLLDSLLPGHALQMPLLTVIFGRPKKKGR
jgi:hypothetical protein